MKKIIFGFFVLLTSYLYSQQTYPLQTILKGDSVVIYTVEQNQDIELILTNQRNRVNLYKNSIIEQERIIDSLNSELQKNKIITDSVMAICDSLQQFIQKEFVECRDLKTRFIETQKWLLNTAIDNAFLFYSHKKSTIMAIDLAPYMFGYRTKYGSFYLVRRGTVDEDNIWRQRNRTDFEEIDEHWFDYFNKKWKPNLIQFPYQIKIQQ
jgi:hypothetical protein